MKVSDSSVPHLATDIARKLRALPKPDAAALRAVRREVSRRVAGDPPEAVIELAVELLEGRAPGAAVVAYELILHHPSALSRVRARELARLGATMSSWGEVDAFGCYVAGRAWRAYQVSDRVIHRWARSRNRWWRRAALVSTVPLNVKSQGGRGDPARTVGVCRLLVEDRDDMVVKAMSWALRALAQRDRRAVRRFLSEWEPTLASRVVREVRNKLTTGLKNPRKSR